VRAATRGPAYIPYHTSCARVRDSLPQQGPLPLCEQSTHGQKADHAPQPLRQRLCDGAMRRMWCRSHGVGVCSNASGRCMLPAASEAPADLYPSLHGYKSLSSVWPLQLPRRSEVLEALARRVGATAYASPEGRVEARRECTRRSRSTTTLLTHTASGVSLRGGAPAVVLRQHSTIPEGLFRDRGDPSAW
jgi:hypothetical protein